MSPRLTTQPCGDTFARSAAGRALCTHAEHVVATLAGREGGTEGPREGGRALHTPLIQCVFLSLIAEEGRREPRWGGMDGLMCGRRPSANLSICLRGSFETARRRFLLLLLH